MSGYLESIDTFAKELRECEIGGIILKARYSEELYVEFLKACEKYHINLIKIPQSTLYTDILQSVMGNLFSYQLSRANYFKSCHETFMKIALSGEGLPEIIETLNEMLHSNILVYDLNNHILAKTPMVGNTLSASAGEYFKSEGTNLEYYYQDIDRSEERRVGKEC